MSWSYGNVTWLEVIWTLAGFGGALNVWYVVLASFGDRSFLKRKKINGIRKLVAEMSFETDVLFLYILVSFGIIGAVAMTQPSTRRPEQPPTITAWVITFVFCSLSFGINLVAYRRRMTRERINEIEAERQARLKLELDGHV